MSVTLNLKHRVVRWVLIVLAVLVLAALVWFTIKRLFPSNPPGLTQGQITSDSLRATKPAEIALIDSSNAKIAARVPASTLAIASAKASQDRANKERARADGLAALAAQQATNSLAWKNAYEARNSEALDLRSTIVEDNTIISNLKADTTELRFQLRTINKRLSDTELANSRLYDDIERLKRCKILGLINCPNRIQTAALTFLVVKGVEKYQAQRK
jgi:hypothetical protein